ncbi:hypothetical protein [Geodermatophilus sabuli]|uniref:Uncharacterized protein n=1 Tax=Geodermatophilus sabuli TaxID=1564158 RepID=A0A285EHS8_9ACTN|nr:hypothetical protein [Geodermatophilus sabuli]MBB3083911.1 hypothetical protein [Geodermatophilus sabuli]SNX98560.1 hypothetical protein SAMN06893097_11174 [Geodermatophilus sabuli]
MALDETTAFLTGFCDHHAPDPDSRPQVDALPLRAADLSGLPPGAAVAIDHVPAAIAARSAPQPA